MDHYTINTFEELYIWLSCPEEKGIKGWHADRESNDMFTLDGGRSGRICIRDQKGQADEYYGEIGISERICQITKKNSGHHRSFSFLIGGIVFLKVSIGT